ncbi:hypothetical protein FQN51_001796 [Onygenales sp. PD_10]|nr:hypothetical protein FQN51_001796 [Onygenales sp. PD_10]
MASRFTALKLLRPLAYASAFAATGGVAFFTSSPSSNRPKSLLPRDIPPRFPRVKSREEQIADLRRSSSSNSGAKKDDEEVYDLLIIGAGATGAGIALDAVTRGLKVAMVERDDFSSGTSSKSTKLVHGGVRYLEKAILNLDYSQYKLVREALYERKYFLDIAPHLSSWLPILLPVRTWWEAPYLWVGTKLYDVLAGRQGSPEGSYFMTKNRALGAFPTLNSEGMVGALVYYDGQHNDSRMNVSLAVTAALYGATVVNHLEVTGLEKDGEGRICGATVRDTVGEDEKESQGFSIRAKGVINATGPFSDAIQKMDDPTQKDIVAPSNGVHIVLPGWLGPKNIGLIDPSSDGRVIFLLPWEGNLIAGTTDNPCKVEKAPIPGDKDIEWILNELRGQMAPEVDLKPSDILAAWSGIRPLVYDPSSKNTESLVRSHLVTVSKSGLLTCAGGKWTTYREMAEDAVNQAITAFNLKPQGLRQLPDISGTSSINEEASAPASPFDGSCQTRNVPVLGAHGYYKSLYIDLIKTFNLDADVAQHLANSYGDRAWEVASLSTSTTSTTSSSSSQPQPQPHPRLSPSYPYLLSEITYAIKNEYAVTAEDILARRTRLAFLDTYAALRALPGLIDVMGDELSWSRARRESEWTRTVGFLASMGLPGDMMGVTREEVVSGKAVVVGGRIGGGGIVAAAAAGGGKIGGAVGEWAIGVPQSSSPSTAPAPSPSADGSMNIRLS